MDLVNTLHTTITLLQFVVCTVGADVANMVHATRLSSMVTPIVYIKVHLVKCLSMYVTVQVLV